jgi:hypothetical protein
MLILRADLVYLKRGLTEELKEVRTRLDRGATVRTTGEIHI